jgi:hypothetical protein
MAHFEQIWNYLQKNLQPGTEVENWTSFNGYLGDKMTIEAIDEDFITVNAPHAINAQVVPQEDFQIVWERWPDYKNGKVRRYELRDMTRYSKYIISILHWYEQEVSNARI